MENTCNLNQSEVLLFWAQYQVPHDSEGGVSHLDTDFMGLRGGHFDLFNDQWLVGLPGNGGLALDHLGANHCFS